MNNTATGVNLFSIDMVAKLPAISAASLSPDGGTVVYEITESINNDYRSTIYLFDLATGAQKILVEGSLPKWSPDGSLIAYIGTYKENAAIFIYDLAKNKEEFLLNMYEPDCFIDHYANNGFCWSPDGQAIAYISAEIVDESNPGPAVRFFADALYKTKGGRGRRNYTEKRYAHIWLFNMKEKQAKQISAGNCNEHSISFSPDGEKICFISNTTGQPDFNQWSDVFILSIATGEIHKTSNERGSAFQPSWSPDGKNIAYLGVSSEFSTNDSPAEDTQLYLVPSSGGAAMNLSASLDRRIEQVSWDPSSSSIYFIAGNAGDTILYRVLLNSGQIEEVIHEKGKIAEYSIGHAGIKMVFTCTDSIHPADIFIYDLQNKNKTQLTQIRDQLSAKCVIQAAETFWYRSFDDCKVQGWIIKPAQFNENKKYPLILVIHGGPHNMFGDEFEERMQLLAANGYGVLFINPRGSSGYGQSFSNGSVRAWGEGDYEDLMWGVDAAIQHNTWVEASRLGVTGQSYGGYMTNRIVTKTKRFKAAVADGSISNLISFSGTSLYHSLLESEYQLSIYDNYEALWNCSPMKYVKNVTTPVLFLHGEKDNEVPFSQAEEMYLALKKLGIKTALVQYVGEGHGWRPNLKPGNRVDLLKRMVSWFDEHLI